MLSRMLGRSPHKHAQNHSIVLFEVLEKKVLVFPIMLLLMHSAALSGWPFAATAICMIKILWFFFPTRFAYIHHFPSSFTLSAKFLVP